MAYPYTDVPVALSLSLAARLVRQSRELSQALSADGPVSLDHAAGCPVARHRRRLRVNLYYSLPSRHTAEGAHLGLAREVVEPRPDCRVRPEATFAQANAAAAVARYRSLMGQGRR